MIETTITRKAAEEKRLQHRSCLSTFTNLIAKGTNCSRFEAEVISCKAEEVFGLGDYGEESRLQPGQMVWRAIDAKEPPGKPLTTCNFGRIILSVHRLEEDVEARSAGGLKAKRQQQITRMCVEAYDQGTLLTQEDLAILLDCDVKTIRNDIRDYQQKHDVLVPTRGTKMDIGPGITHREKAVELFVQGKNAAAIARDLNHSLKAVERYITTFCRTVYAQQQEHNSLKTAMIVGISVSLVDKHLALRDKWIKTSAYSQRIQEIEKCGLQFWEAQDAKKKDSRKNGGQP